MVMAAAFFGLFMRSATSPKIPPSSSTRLNIWIYEFLTAVSAAANADVALYYESLYCVQC